MGIFRPADFVFHFFADFRPGIFSFFLSSIFRSYQGSYVVSSRIFSTPFEIRKKCKKKEKTRHEINVKRRNAGRKNVSETKSAKCGTKVCIRKMCVGRKVRSAGRKCAYEKNDISRPYKPGTALRTNEVDEAVGL